MPPTPPRDAQSSSSSSSARQAEQAEEPSAPGTEHQLAEAFRDLAMAEQAAIALEANLTSLESKLDELLASFESAAGPAPSTNGIRKYADGKEGDGAEGRRGGGQGTTDN